MAMRIAQISPLVEAVPPRLYGGTERIVSYLTEELVALGHDVTLFASGDSVTSAGLRAMCPQALRLDRTVRDRVAPHQLMLEVAAQAASEFDIMHFHFDYQHFALFRRVTTSCLTTLHSRLDLPELVPVFKEFDEFALVSISDAQREPVAFANWMGTVHHGLPPLPAGPRPVPEGYLAFLGRFAPEKRADVAIRLARRAGCRIRVAAKVDADDQAYFDEVVAPILGEPHVDFVGEIDENEKLGFLGRARALLFLIDWPEPFGLVMIEAMRCGTPVIAFRRGSVAEVIDDGITGFIVDTEAEALAAIERVDALDRERIRQTFLRRFSSRRMAKEYVSLYRRLLSSRRSRARSFAVDALAAEP